MGKVKGLVFGVGVNDADYTVCKETKVNGKRVQVVCPFYRAWTSMHQRCEAGGEQMKYLLICTLFSSNLALAQQPLGYPQRSYQQGYQQGYQLGQCVGSIYCTPGAAPAAPAPEAGMNTYEGGIYQGVHDKESGADEFHSDIDSYKNWPNNYEDE